MYYFLNDNLQAAKSGIEHAEIARLRLFQAHHIPAKIVTRQFSLQLPAVLRAAGIDRQHFVNLIEFFCGTAQVPDRPATLQDLGLPTDATVSRTGRQCRVTWQDQLLLSVYFQTDQSNQIRNVQTFDTLGQTLQMSWWDARGFKCLVQLFDQQGKIVQEQYLGPDGRVHLEKCHLLGPNDREQVTWRLVNWPAGDRTFPGLQSLTRYFYDCLNQATGQNVFICDRTVECGWALFHMHTEAKRVLHLHNDHVSDPTDMQHSPLNNNYQNALINWDRWDAVITATPEQARDIRARFGTTVPTFTIPVGYVLPHTAPASFATRQPGLVVQVARLAPEKQQNHTIAAFAQVHQHCPQARLELWGYANGDTEQQLKQQVAELGLTDVVRFCGYTTDVGTVYDRAQVGVLPSRTEGFSLTLLEAQSHGLPMIANDIKYGPSDILQDGVSGRLTTNGDIEQLAGALQDLLEHPQKLREFSTAAYQNAQRYSAARVFACWQQLLTYFASSTKQVATGIRD